MSRRMRHLSGGLVDHDCDAYDTFPGTQRFLEEAAVARARAVPCDESSIMSSKARLDIHPTAIEYLN